MTPSDSALCRLTCSVTPSDSALFRLTCASTGERPFVIQHVHHRPAPSTTLRLMQRPSDTHSEGPRNEPATSGLQQRRLASPQICRDSRCNLATIPLARHKGKHWPRHPASEPSTDYLTARTAGVDLTSRRASVARSLSLLWLHFQHPNAFPGKGLCAPLCRMALSREPGAAGGVRRAGNQLSTVAFLFRHVDHGGYQVD